MANKLWNKNFSLLVIGQFISIFGNAVLTFTLPLYALYLSGSPALYGVVLGLPFVAIMIASPIGGIMADRLKKQRILFWLDAAVVLIIALYMVASGLFANMIPIVILKLLALNAIQGMYAPTVYAGIPALVPESKLVAANSAVTTVDTLSNVAAPAVAGILFGNFGLFPILAVAAICFGVTAVIDLFIQIPYNKQTVDKGMFQIIKGDMSEAVLFVGKKNPRFILFIGLYFLIPVLIGPIIVVGIPIFITQDLNMGMEYIGIVKGVGWVGGILGSMLAGFLGERLSIRSVPFTATLLGLSIIPIGAVLLFDMPISLAYIAMIGANIIYTMTFLLFMIAIDAHIQKITPEALIGKVMSLFTAIPYFASGLGFVLFGILFERFYAISWLIIFASACIVGVAMLSLRKHLTKTTDKA